jgi:hypothetical protein
MITKLIPMMRFDELDSVTRECMLKEFLAEQKQTNPFRSKEMTELGMSEFLQIMERSISGGNEITLAKDLANPSYWQRYSHFQRKGKSYQRRIDPSDCSTRFALTEFNTWYVRGFSWKLIEEGEEFCEIYRAAYASQPRPECQDHDGKRFKVIDVYKGHRARYWPTTNEFAFSIPIGPNCHHTIRRIKHE